MITEYVQAALNETEYEWMEEEGEYFAAPTSLPGAWATGKTVEEARAELAEVIEGYLLIAARFDNELPEIGEVRFQMPMKSPQLAEDERRGD